MKVYADTSFLVSLYSLDSNSVQAAATMRSSKGDHYISVLGELETLNALELRVFRKELSRSQARASLKDFQNDLQQGVFMLCPVSDQVFARAHRLLQQTTARLGTRTADILHVAAALELGVDRLYSFDQQQRRLAETVRLKVN